MKSLEEEFESIVPKLLKIKKFGNRVNGVGYGNKRLDDAWKIWAHAFFHGQIDMNYPSMQIDRQYWLSSEIGCYVSRILTQQDIVVIVVKPNECPDKSSVISFASKINVDARYVFVLNNNGEGSLYVYRGDELWQILGVGLDLSARLEVYASGGCGLADDIAKTLTKEIAAKREPPCNTAVDNDLGNSTAELC